MSEWQEGEKYKFPGCVCGFQTDIETPGCPKLTQKVLPDYAGSKPTIGSA